MIGKEIICLDNVLGNNILRTIQQNIFSTNFPWIYFPSTGTDRDMDTGSFSNIVFMNNHRTDPETSIKLEMCLMSALDSIKLDLTELFRIRIGMLLKSEKSAKNFPHVDSPSQHLVALLYLTTCDAPTLIYNERYDHTMPHIGSYDYYHKHLNATLTLKEKIDSVENRMVIFDGHYYHSSTTPTNVDRRIAINYNFNVGEK